MSGRLGMETALQLHHPLRRILSYTSPLPINIPSSNPQNLRAHSIFAAREEQAAVLSLKRRRPGNTTSRQSRALSHTTPPPPPPPPPRPLMADKAPQNDAAATTPPSDKSEKPSPPPHPPPEKPLPGDCCGSGCVRCVWDVYYEELEEYNKLYKTDSDPKSKPL